MKSTSRKLSAETWIVVEKSLGPMATVEASSSNGKGQGRRDLSYLLLIGGGGKAQLPEGDMAGDPRASL